MIWKSQNNKIIAQFADFATVIISITLSFYVWSWLYNNYHMGSIPKPYNVDIRYILIPFITSIIYVIIFNFNKSYNFQRFTSLQKECLNVLIISVQGLIIFVFLSFIFGL